jgi:hypothetical protein
VTHFRKFGAVVLLLASFLTPTMACAVADSPMTGEERACCQMMTSQCGQKGMLASNGRCQKVAASVYDNALNTRVVTFHPVVLPVILSPALRVGNSTSSFSGWTGILDYSPPKSPPSTIFVLRI